MRRLQWAALWVGSAGSLLASLGMANIWFDVGSVRGHYIHQYSQFFSIRVIWIALLAGTAAVALLAISESLVRRREWTTVLMWIVAALALQALLRTLTLTTFERNIRSAGAFSFYTVTQRFPPRFVLGHFEELRPELPLHAQSNMPGRLMFMYALELVTSRPDILPWLIVLVSNAGGLLMYVFVRDFFSDRLTALYALVLYLLMPAKLFFFPLLNTVTPVIVLLALVLVLRSVRTSRVVYAAAMGPVVYALAFFDPTALSMGLLMAALIAHALWMRAVAWRTVVLQVAVGALTFTATYLSVRVGLRFDLFSTMRDLGVAAAGFNVRHDRPYGIWVRQNLLDFFFGVGICQTALAAVAVWRRSVTEPIVVLSGAVAAVLLVLDLAGINRGEVIRLWIFLACVFQVPVAYVCARLGSRVAMAAVVATSVLQVALGTFMIGFIGY